MQHLRRALSVACAGLSALLAVAHASAQTPAAVEVRFVLKDSKFRTQLAADAAQLEKNIAAMIAEQLGTRVGFVRFVVGQSADHVLSFSLDRRERTSSGPFDERGLWANLALKDGSKSEIYWLKVRSENDALLPVGSKEAFQRELTMLLTHANYEALKTELFAQVPIATRALAWASPLGWALPFSHQQLCMKKDAQLKIVNELPSGDARLELPYQARAQGQFNPASLPQELQSFKKQIFTVPEPSDRLDLLSRALSRGQVKVLGVYVTQYKYDESVCRNQPLRPSTSGPGGGAP